MPRARMTCRNCGATIADKAIVCYRCGTATADPASLRPARPEVPRGGINPWLLVVLVVVGIFGWWVLYTPTPETLVRWGIPALVVSVVLALRNHVVRRRRRR
jgi:hypothetical protein